MDDYLELPLYLEDIPENRVSDVWVMGKDSKIIGVFKNVDSCIRYKGWWTIGHEYIGLRMTSAIPSELALYFNILERDADV